MSWQVTILGICASLQAGSSNLTPLHEAGALMPADVDFTIFEGLGDIPHFNPDHEAAGAPDQVVRLRAMLQAADGVLIASLIDAVDQRTPVE